MNSSALRVGAKGSASTRVDHAQTAECLGSGIEPVFATPAMIALMEAVALACVEAHVPDGQISLGTHIAVDHLAATPVGQLVTANAELMGIDGRLMHFAVTAHEGETLIGRGRHSRALVDRQRFLSRLARPQSAASPEK